MANIGSIVKLPELAGSIGGIRTALKGISSSNWFKGLAGGVTIFIIVIVAGGLWLLFRYLDSKIPAKRSTSHSGGGNGGKKHRKNKGGSS